ncbi:3D-(3,5/4)-trihydroxycyclohexane-1,2-dione hydrolase [Candidatus Gugararchaeum adminiculabundum]|nr:3D-(3,5/4)-trihydroxycyclohexane-1,2-dione hydrolase [Candidatus Gugararchaeum adminiculabundum]
MAKMKGAKAVVEALKKEGVTTMFGFPGGANMPIYDALIEEEKNLRHILVRHEQGAAHAAEGYARASGTTGVCMATSGPGGTNLLTGIADAYLDSVPIVAITAQVSSHLIGGDAFQEADLFGLTMPITKHNYKILDAQELPKVFKEAFALTRLGRPGPVAIDIPKDVLNTMIEFNYPKGELKIPGYQPQLIGHPEQIKKAVDMIVAAERPLILAGGGIIASNAHQELVALAEALFAPVTTTLMAKGAISDLHPLCLNQPGMHGRVVANWAIQNCDLLICIGARFDDRITGDPATFATNAKIIHIDIDTAEIGKNVRVHLPIVGDAKSILTEMLKMLANVKYTKGENEWRKRIKELKRECTCDFNLKGNPIKPQKVIWELNQLMPKDGILVTEVGQHQMFAMHFYKAPGPRQFISSGGLGTMGFGLPAAIGAKAAKPDKTVVDLAGDGSILMVNQEFTTSVEHDLPVAAVVLNNNWLGMVKQWQKLFFEKRYSGTNLGKMPNFVKLIEAYHGKGERVERESEVHDALQRALKTDVAFLLDIVTDPEEDILPMVPAGGRLDHMILGKPCPKI